GIFNGLPEDARMFLDGREFRITYKGGDGNDVVLLIVTDVSVAGDVVQNEGNTGQTPFVFTVNLAQAVAAPVSINYATADGTATVADNDYVPTSGTLTFAAGETSKTITVFVNGDNIVEGDETFSLILSNAVGANIGNGTATGTIVNDDHAPVANDDDAAGTA